MDRLALFKTLQQEINQRPFERKNINTQAKDGLKYLLYRIKRPLLKLKYQKFQMQNSQKPWLTPDAIYALEKLLTKEDIGIEYGSGRSTYFFSKLLGQLTSIEHHKGWYEQVAKQLRENDCRNVNYHHIPANRDFTAPSLSSEQQAFMTTKEYPVKDDVFHTYSTFVTTVPNQSLGFALIDGRARVSCALNSISKLKIGGIMVLDNSERTRYRAVHDALSNWPKLETTTGLTDTTLWIKP
ncbi:class I SAM-dependent methyltransferase [Roseivirga pacifica]|uniref:class I SAM-dependent methyltransferase n=1 Tax=Roseivirga pacifica TaxID=1267423 RepID=UPI003BB0F635